MLDIPGISGSPVRVLNVSGWRRFKQDGRKKVYTKGRMTSH